MEDGVQTGRLLLVEDHHVSRDVLGRLLQLGGWHVSTACDGLEAMARLADGFRPDIIVTDYMMPRLDGVALIDQIKRDPSLSQIPTVLVSAADLRLDPVQGVDAYLRKPIDVVDLEKRLRYLCHPELVDELSGSGAVLPPGLHDA